MGIVHLPVNPPVLPMLSKRTDELPMGGTWIFEPKWDGFRVLVFREGRVVGELFGAEATESRILSLAAGGVDER